MEIYGSVSEAGELGLRKKCLFLRILECHIVSKSTYTILRKNYCIFLAGDILSSYPNMVFIKQQTSPVAVIIIKA